MAREGFEPRPCRSRFRRFNHSTTLPTKLDGIVNCWKKGGMLLQATTEEGSGNDVEVDKLIPDNWFAEDWTMTISFGKNLQTQQSVTKVDVLNSVRRMHSSEENIEHEEDKETQVENEVTASTRRDMLKTIRFLWKGLLFLNVDDWSLLSKLDHAVDQATKNEVKQSKID